VPFSLALLVKPQKPPVLLDLVTVSMLQKVQIELEILAQLLEILAQLLEVIDPHTAKVLGKYRYFVEGEKKH
jgi:hypothetical protein